MGTNNTVLFLDDDPKVTAKYIDDSALDQQIKSVSRYLLQAVSYYNKREEIHRDIFLFWILESESNFLFLLSYLDILHKELRLRKHYDHSYMWFLIWIKRFCRDNYFIYDGVTEFKYFGPKEYRQTNSDGTPEDSLGLVFDSYLELYNKEMRDIE